MTDIYWGRGFLFTVDKPDNIWEYELQNWKVIPLDYPNCLLIYEPSIHKTDTYKEIPTFIVLEDRSVTEAKKLVPEANLKNYIWVG